MLDANRLCPGCMNENTGEKVCSICGYDIGQKNPENCLNVKFILKSKYLIGKVLDASSEGITYLAWDGNLNEPVNIKEYYPLGIATRNPDKTVSVGEGKSFSFNEGLLEFLELNRKLCTLELPAVLPIYDVFEDNGTAYVVFAQNTGITLSSFLERNSGMLKWEQARPLFLPLIDTVITLNNNRIIHGGISPESITVSRDGKLKLTNISIIETRFASEMFATAIYPGCAAIEQYSTEKGNIGAFSDVYGISSTLFRVLIGTLPPPANERMSEDKMSIPSHFADELPRQVLVAIANGLQLKLSARTNSVEQFKDELVYGETQENIRKAEIRKKQKEIDNSKRIAEKISEPKKDTSSVKYALIAASCTAGAFIIIGGILALTVLKDYFFPKKVTEEKEINSMPSVASIGEYESGADIVKVKTYAVPDLTGKYFSQIDEDEACEDLVIVIGDKKFSDTAPRGTICGQSVTAGKEVVKDTEISVTISLGPKKIKMANVTGLKEDEAKLELLKQGFLYENIEIIEKYDTDKTPETVIEQFPESGESVNTDIAVKIYVNSYKDENAEEN